MLTIKEILYTQEFLQDLNDKKAQERAGYTSYDPTLLDNPEIQREIERLVQEKTETLQITSDYVLSNLKKIADDCMKPIPKTQMNKDGDQFFFTDPDGNMMFEKNTNQALKALELLGKYHALFTDKSATELNATTNATATIKFEDYLNKVEDEEEW